MTIKNGMTIQLREDITQSQIDGIQKAQQLIGKTIELKGNGASAILDDNVIMIKGIGNFPTEIFEEAPEETGEYCIILVTKDCEGRYQYYDNVLYHDINEIGVYIECANGDEHFHPWTFEGGIQRITKRDEYYV